MADITAGASAVIFVAILVLVGVVVFGYASDLMPHDAHHTNELVIAAGCSNDSEQTINVSGCSGTVNFPSGAPIIENSTRSQPIAQNCSATTGGTCTTLTAGAYYFNNANGTFTITDDQWNGSILVSYYSNDARAVTDLAQQSIEGTALSGFDLAMVAAIVMAAVAVVGGVLLIGRGGA